MTALALAVLLASAELLAQAPRGMGMAPRRAEAKTALPDLSSVPIPVLDVFEPAVAYQLDQARKDTADLIDAGRVASIPAFGTLCMLYLRYELLEAAEPCLRQARALEPRDLRWPYYQTYVYTRAGDVERARKSVAAVLDISPREVPALLRAGDLALLAQDLGKAEAAYRSALDSAPDSGAALFALGRVAAARGDHAAAAERFEAALVTQPEGSIVHYHLGMEYRALGDLDRARAELAKNHQVEIAMDDPLIAALQGLSESRETTFARGIELLERGRNEEAIATFERVLELDPKDAQAHYNLARALIEERDLERAEKHLRDAIVAWPDFFDAHLNLAILLGRTGRGGEAAEHIERAVKIDPEHAPTRLLYARVLSQRGDHAGAIRELEEVLRVDPASVEARMALAELEAMTGDLAAAKLQLEGVIASAAAGDSDRARAHQRLALLPRTPPNEVEAHLRAAAELDPSSVEARGALAERLAHTGRFEQAAAELERLVEIAPDDPRPRVGLATTLVLAGDYPRARAALDEGIRRFPDSLPIQQLLAQVLATCTDAALRDGTRALKIAQGLVERQLSIDHVETLAMALAEVGSWDEAAMWQRRAIEREAATGADTAASRRRLELYEAKRPVREPWKEHAGAADARTAPPP